MTGRLSPRPTAVAVVVLALVGLVAALGGFARATPTQGTERAAGEVVELARFRVAVDTIELTDTDAYGYQADPTLELRLTAATTAEETENGLPLHLVTLIADGVTLPDAYSRSVDGWDDDLEPGLTQPIRYVLDWTAPAPRELQVALFDEQRSPGFLADGESWSVDRSHPAALITVPVVDRRTHR